MKVPFLNLKLQLSSFRGEVENRFAEIIDNTGFVCGKNVAEFEQSFAQLQASKFAVGLSSGTDGNHISMVSANVKPGDEVIIPVNTFIATAWGPILCGARPVFVDIEPDYFCIDPSKIEAVITSRTKAINPVHLFGHPADMDRIIEIAKPQRLSVIEDAAQAHCSKYKGKKVGALGDSASWSFYPGKNLGAWGEAGALTTNREEIYRHAKKSRDHGSDTKYYHDSIGHNYRMSEFQAAVLVEKMKFIEAWTEQRRRNATLYNDRLKNIEQITLPKEAEYAEHVYHLYVIRVSGNRSELQSFLQENGIGTGIHYPFPLHLTEALKDLGYQKGDFPVAEQAAEEILSLPMFPELTESQIEYVGDVLEEFFA